MRVTPNTKKEKRTHSSSLKKEIKTTFISIAAGMILAGCTFIFINHINADTPYAEENLQTDRLNPETAISNTGLYDLDMATLEKVVDGDTLWVVKNGEREKVRLIGIDTPESVHPDKEKNNEYGKMASEYVKTLLADTKYVYLTYDEETTDRYDRTLAYVWLSDNTSDIANMLNAAILLDGYAVNKEYEPNVKYSSEFETLRNMAEESNVGLWAYDEYKELIYGEETH